MARKLEQYLPPVLEDGLNTDKAAVFGSSVQYSSLSDGTTTLGASTLEVNRNCQVSVRKVAAGGTLTVTTALHDGKIIALDTAAGSTLTLPAATGSGAVFRVVVSVKATSNQHKVQVANANDTMSGSVNLLDNDSTAQTAYAASGTDDTLTWNGTTTGGQVGDWADFVDILANVWAVRGQAVCPTGSNIADCFSAAV